jgi:hypothetical protein
MICFRQTVKMLRWLILNIVFPLVILRHQPQGINEAKKREAVLKIRLLSGKDITRMVYG